MLEEIRQVLRQEAEAVQSIPVTDAYEKAILLIEEHVHRLKGKLVVSGMGKAGQIALNIATTFSSTGTPAVFLHPSDAQHGDLGVIQPNDVLLLISNSGKTREILELVDLAENLYKGLPLIVITSNKESQLAMQADVCLETGNPKEVCILGLTPSTSTTVMTVIGDVLVVMMMKRINFSNEDYAKRHHGGYLGDKSRMQAGLKK
ncbi:MAG TPA: iron dicitrate transport regulator FecR [Prolixibacteraceae bacterium]|nr:iron dicitrate transport regulator FecR [Prolixibacteraceae bacterium]